MWGTQFRGGTLRCGPPAYLTEFEYRFNSRRDVHIFEKTVAEMLQAKPMQMKELTA